MSDGEFHGAIERWKARATAAEAEIARLREALEDVMRQGSGEGKYPNSTVVRMHRIARAALSRTEASDHAR